MDKQKTSPRGTYRQQKGFALIITLSVLAIVIALTGVLIGYLDVARKEASATKALVQANLYFADVKQILGKFKDKKALYNTLYLTPVPLQSEDGRFSLVLQCHPLDNGVNINWLADENSVKMQAHYAAAQKVFDYLAEKYALANPLRLEEMLLHAIHGTEEGQSRFVRKNGIISYQQFMQILSRYQFETDDKAVGRVPWKDYFVFHSAGKRPEENLIAGDFVSKALLAALFEIDPALLKEEWAASEGALKLLLQAHGIPFDKHLFASKFSERAGCEVHYMYEGERFAFAFKDQEGEVNEFEFFRE